MQALSIPGVGGGGGVGDSAYEKGGDARQKFLILILI